MTEAKQLNNCSTYKRVVSEECNRNDARRDMGWTCF
jgi:hypothetical protein